MSERRDAHYNQYSGHYRTIDRLSAPWVASPDVDRPARLTASQGTPESAELVLADTKPVPSPTRDRPKRKRCAVADLLRRWANKSRLANKINGEIATVGDLDAQPAVDDEAAGTSGEVDAGRSDEVGTKVPLQDWKAWGYYACPRLHHDGGYVKNYPPLSHIPSNVNVEEVYRNLKDDSGEFYPDRWIQGLQHSALPPRPERWKEHIKGAPLPFPCKCQLNPLLQHSAFDKPPLDWDIHYFPSSRCYLGRTGNAIITIADPDKAQPATYPFVTHMYINSLADDPYPEHFWPFYVVNEHGVTVGDVLETIWENYQQFISRSEFDSWANLLSRQQTATHAVKMRALHAEARRIDVLGTQCLFKGLEPHPNHEGWSMFLGLG